MGLADTKRSVEERQSTEAIAASSLEARRTRLHLFLIILVFSLVYIPGLFHPGLLDDADSVHAEVAREMITRGDWVTLYADGIRYLEKAPLMYWGIAASFKLFGVGDWSARLPLALGTLWLLLATYYFGRRAFGEKAGFYSALALATSIGPYLFTRFLIPDILVTLWLTLSLHYFLRGFEGERPSRLACWGLAAATALNVLTKGLIGLVFPAAIVGIYLLLTGKLRHLLRMRLLSSTIVFLGIAAPWHILAALHNPAQGQVRGFLWFYFVNEHFLRYLNERLPRDYGTVPLLLFWVLLLVWMLPWSAFIVHALGQIPRRIRAWRDAASPRDRALPLLAVWAILIPLFFSFSTRQEYYNLPALPALALLIGNWLARESTAEATSALRRTGRRIATLAFGIGIIAFACSMFFLSISKPVPPGSDIADLLAKHPQDYVLSMGHFLDLTPEALGAFHVPLLGAGLAFLLGTGLNWLFRRRGCSGRGNWALAGMMVAFLYCAHLGLVVFSPVLSSKQLALAVKKEYRPGDIIVINGEYEGGSTLNFYTGAQVHMLNGRSADLWYGSFFPDAPSLFEDNASLVRLWTGPQRVYLWTEEETRDLALRGIDAATVHVLARSGGKLILTNRG